jgi:hypothetical protein
METFTAALSKLRARSSRSSGEMSSQFSITSVTPWSSACLTTGAMTSWQAAMMLSFSDGRLPRAGLVAVVLVVPDREGRMHDHLAGAERDGGPQTGQEASVTMGMSSGSLQFIGTS